MSTQLHKKLGVTPRPTLPGLAHLAVWRVGVGEEEGGVGW